jgi:hypothetical protein
VGSRSSSKSSRPSRSLGRGSRLPLPSRERYSGRMSHLVAGHDVPMQVEDILKRRARVGREAEALCASLRRDPGRCQDKPTGQLGVGQIGNRPNVRARYHEHVQRRRSRLGVERDEVGILEADRRWGLVRCDPAKHAASPGVAHRNFTRPSRSGGFSASPSSTRITNFFSQCGVGYAPSLRSMFWNDPSGILIAAG